MKTIKTYFALSTAGAGMFALLALAPLALEANTVGVSAHAGATVCTMEARQCPDGSWVGRSGPYCEFKCPGATTTAATFSASPKTGDAPLTVRFTSSLAEPDRYTIAFGDGARTKYGTACDSATPAQCSLTHTYAKDGVYTAVLIKDACPDNVQCIWAGQTVGKATITVGTTTADNDNDNDGDHDHGHMDNPGKHYGWFNWFSNFHFSFWPFWK